MSAPANKPNVFLSRTVPPEGLVRLREHCEVRMYDKGLQIPFDEFLKSVVGIDALVVFPGDTVNKEALDAAGPQLKVVCSFSVGLDHIDREECKKRGIKVGYTPDVLTNSTAELILALTLATSRRLKEAFQTVHNGEWGSTWDNGLWMAGHEIAGSVIGIVGLGKIGFAVAKRLNAFEPSKIVYSGNEVKSYASDINAEFVTFKNLLNISDFIVCTCSLNSMTKNLFNADTFKEMKSSCVFINASRGTVVDQEALYNALTSKQIAAAGLDVTTPEPLPTDHKLISLPNCVISPHIGSATTKTRIVMINLVVDNIFAGLKGEPLPTPAY